MPDTSDTLFRILGDSTRRRILDLLAERGPLTVGQLAAEFPDLVASGISKHLMSLRAGGLVSATRRGREQIYQLQPDALAAGLAPWIAKYERYWSQPSNACVIWHNPTNPGRYLPLTKISTEETEMKLNGSALVLAFSLMSQSAAQTAKTAYQKMAPLPQYLIPRDAETALARSAAPQSISGSAEILILAKDGFHTAVKGSNGFVCMVARSWSADYSDPGFWDPKLRAPICYNSVAANLK